MSVALSVVLAVAYRGRALHCWFLLLPCPYFYDGMLVYELTKDVTVACPDKPLAAWSEVWVTWQQIKTVDVGTSVVTWPPRLQSVACTVKRLPQAGEVLVIVMVHLRK